MNDHDGDEGPYAGIDPAFPLPAMRGPGSASGWLYSEALGQAIAELYGESPVGGLSGLRAYAPDRIPPVAIIHAWKRQYPAFGMMMREAERVRAEILMEQTLVIADGGGHPAALALRISSRQTLAGRLDAQRYGKASGEAPATLGHDVQPTALDLDDATLASIAAQGRDNQV